jgi:hypothetical protein
MDIGLAEYLSTVLNGIGAGIAANEISRLIQSNAKPTPQQLDAFMRLHNVQAYAPNVIKACVELGYLTIDSSNLYGEHGATVGAGAGGQFAIAGSQIATGTGSYVHVPEDGSITGGNESSVHQDSDGNVIFDVGSGGIRVNVGGSDVVVSTGRKR